MKITDNIEYYNPFEFDSERVATFVVDAYGNGGTPNWIIENYIRYNRINNLEYDFIYTQIAEPEKGDKYFEDLKSLKDDTTERAVAVHNDMYYEFAQDLEYVIANFNTSPGSTFMVNTPDNLCFYIHFPGNDNE